ncbi:zinc finger protein 267-like isoform X7 [Nilaparvata lugens]|uniref:zinc finger protein 267-like isoform X7 n=1 Tax=Nilaparvata lugens TaxID=108931 RepID=UPI00193D0C8E|nr:zinc finger protein 267-like isoform X7 [Nilaparvata lugens]
MEYHICKKIAKVVIEKLKDGSPTSSQQNGFQVKIERGICETNHIKEEPQPNSNQMATVTVKKEEEEEEDDDSSHQPAAVEDDCSQQHYLIPGYNMIFIKEEAYDEQDAEENSVKTEPEMWPSNCSTSGRDYTTESQTAVFQSMEYHICKKIAKVVIERLKDGSPTSSQQNRFQVKIERGICETNHIKEEPQPNSNQMESVSVKMEEEEDDSSQQPAAVEDDCSQQHYLIPGYNMIFIKEESYDEQDAEENSVRTEPEMWPTNCSTSGRDYATEVGGLNEHSTSPVEKCTESSVAGKKTKLYSCAHCSYKTPWFSHLKRHIRKHTGKKPFSCKFCEYKCAQLGNLKVHIRTHTGETPFSCEFCDFKTARSSSLKAHIRTHTGETPFSCDFCDYKCAQSGTLKVHIRTHIGETRLSCEFCDFKTDQSSNLKTHIRTHTGETSPS